MKLHRIDKIPQGFTDYDSEPFSEYDIERIPPEIDEAWYWYGSGSYCGTGHILMRSFDGRWAHHYCGHCSCYGPMEYVELNYWPSLKNFLANCTPALIQELEPLTDAIKAQS